MIYEIIKLLLIVYVLRDMASFIGEVISEWSIRLKSFLKSIVLVFTYVLTCNKCFSFWFSLILSGDLFVASLIALSMKVIGVIENKYIQKTNL